MELDEKTVGHPVSLDQKSLYRVGGMAAILLAIAYVVIVPLYAEVGAPPSGGHAWFKYLDGKTTIWWWIVALSVITDFLFVPVAWALHLALQRGGQKCTAAGNGVRRAVRDLGPCGPLVSLRLDPRPLRQVFCSF